jgi:hypothetical protein
LADDEKTPELEISMKTKSIIESHTDGTVDAESRMRLRSIDVQLLRILEEMNAGREDSVSELRADIAVLTQVLRDRNKLDFLRTTGLVVVAIILGYFFGVN